MYIDKLSLAQSLFVTLFDSRSATSDLVTALSVIISALPFVPMSSRLRTFTERASSSSWPTTTMDSVMKSEGEKVCYRG
jgi:hypothetical protein